MRSIYPSPDLPRNVSKYAAHRNFYVDDSSRIIATKRRLKFGFDSL